MRKYHILFFEMGKELYSTGENFQADSIVEAYTAFRKTHPNAKFIGLYDLDALNSLHINRASIQNQVDIDEQYNKEYP